MKTYSQAQTSCRPAAEQVPAARESKSAWREENRRGGWRREERRGEEKGREQRRWLAGRWRGGQAACKAGATRRGPPACRPA